MINYIKNIVSCINKSKVNYTLSIKRNNTITAQNIGSKCTELKDILNNIISTPNITVITGNPNIDKTTFTIKLANQITKQGYYILYFSYEMNSTKFKSKHITKNYFIHNDASPFYLGRENNNKQHFLLKKLNIVNNEFCFIDCTLNLYNINNIENTIESYINSYNVSPIIFIDYQYMSYPPLDNKKYPIKSTDCPILDYNVKGMKKIISKFKCPIILTTILNENSTISDEYSTIISVK